MNNTGLLGRAYDYEMGSNRNDPSLTRLTVELIELSDITSSYVPLDQEAMILTGPLGRTV